MEPTYSLSRVWFFTIELGFTIDPEAMLDDMKDWADADGHIFRKKLLQNNNTVRKIWFCPSHDNLDVEALQEAQRWQYKFDLNVPLDLSLQYATIKDNNSGFYDKRKNDLSTQYGSVGN